MVIYRAYRACLNDLLEILDCTNFLDEPKVEDKLNFVRLEEEPFVITSEIEYAQSIVTAHKLSQYVKTFGTVKLKDQSRTWLSILVQQDIDKKESIYETNGT